MNGGSTPISLTFYGEPVGKARARIFKDKAGNIRAVTPTKTRSWEESLREQAISQMRGKNPFGEAIKVQIQFGRSYPKSMSKKKRLTARPTTRPDLDNYVKAVKDALRGIVWIDDSIIVELFAEKWYSEKPGVHIQVQIIGGSQP